MYQRNQNYDLMSNVNVTHAQQMQQ